jgi:GNAT superfamily N-acetyltransferase
LNKKEMQIHIRRAQDSDLNPIARFQVAMAWETEHCKLDQGTVLKGVEAVLNNNALGVYYVAVAENQVVGSLLTTFEWSDWRNGTVVWLQSVYVDPRFRKQGVYGALYTHIKTLIAADESLKGIRLYVDESNKQARQVYSHLGMDGDHYSVFEWMKE